MKPIPAKKAVVIGLALALALPSSAFAASQSSPISEDLTVQSTLTLAGVPASVTYGTGLGGTTRAAAPFNLTTSTNSTAGMTLTWSATNLTNGGGSILASARSLKVGADPDSPTPTCNLPGGFATWGNGNGASYGAPAGTAKLVCDTLGATNITLSGVVLSVAVPANATPGVYSGTTTFTATEK